MKRLFIALVIIWLIPRLLFAQLSGSYLIGPSQTYSNLASIISDLNTQGINGSVTVSIPANYVETTPAGGFALGSTILNASLNSTSTLQFVKSGVGKNPLIYAAPGKYAGRKLGGLSDVIWALEGCDYVSVDGIDLCDSTSNTTRTTANEVGYGFFKLNAAAPFDGCQHNLIQHCTIRLQSKTITGNLDIKSVGIYLFNKTRLGGTVNTLQTGMSLTSASDANSFNRFYSNTIIGPNIGALLVGSYSMYDDGNDFGGYSTATGNAIYSFGNDTISSAVFVKGGVTDLNISNNIFDNTQASSYSMSNTCSAYMVGIYTEVDFKPTIKSVFGLRIVNNQLTMGMATTTLQFQQTLHCDGMSIDFHDDILIDSNQINFNTANVVNSNGLFSYGILIPLADSKASLVVRHNTIGGLLRNKDFNAFAIIPFPKAKEVILTDNIVQTQSNDVANYNAFWIDVPGLSDLLDIRRNKISAIHLTSPNNSDFIGFKLSTDSCKVVRLDSNIINNITADRITGMTLNYNHADSVFITNNQLTAFTSEGDNTGIIDKPGNNSSNTVAMVDHNVISNFKNGDLGHDLIAYYRKNSNGQFCFKNNSINNFTNSIINPQTYLVFGLRCDWANTMSVQNALLYNNVISVGNSFAGLSTNSTVSDLLSGIWFSRGNYNKIELFNNSVSVFGKLSSRYVSASPIVVNKTDSLTMKNNIFANYCDFDVSFPNGYITDISVDSIQSLSANNNAYYIQALHDSTVFLANFNKVKLDSLQSYQAAVSPQENASFYEEFPFISTDCTASGFMQFSPSIMTKCESGGTSNLPIVLNSDIIGNKRFGTIGYAGIGTAIDVGAYEMNCSSYVNPIQLINAQISPVLNSCSAIARTVTCSLTVAPGFSINTVQLKYSWNGSIQAPITMNNISANTWSAILPVAVPASAIVKFYVEAIANNNNTVRSSISTFQDAMFNATQFEIQGRREFGCSSNSTQYNLISLGDTSSMMPLGYGIAKAMNNAHSDILNVSLLGYNSSINNVSSFTSTGGTSANGLMASQLGMYSNYTSNIPVINLVAGQNYPISVTVQAPAGTGTVFGCLDVYIDFNRNARLEASERVFFTPYSDLAASNMLFIDSSVYSGIISIPVSIINGGKTLMRVTYHEQTYIPDGESFYNLGETEDYIVNICSSANPNLNYVWTDNGASIGTNASFLNYTNASLGNHVLQVVVTDQGLCQSSDTANIVVKSPANVYLTPASVQTLCKSDSIVFTVTYPSTIPQLTWFQNTASLNNISGANYTAHQAGDYYVLYNDGNCIDTTNHVKVNYFPSPAASYSALISPSNRVCYGQSLSINVNGLSAMNWTPAYVNGTTFIPLQSTQYNVSGMDANNCSYQDHFTVLVDTLPSHVVITGNPVINMNSPFYYAVNSVAGQTYQWLINGGSIVNGQGTNSIGVLWNSGSPTYSLGVIVSNASGCADTFNLALSFSNGLNDLGSNVIRLYPSPASDNITFSISANSSSNKPYRIENVLGQVLLRGEYLGRETRVDVSSLTDGIYYLKLDQYSMPFVVGH